MAVPHGDRLATDRELDGTAKATTLVFTHGASPSNAQGACSARARRASIAVAVIDPPVLGPGLHAQVPRRHGGPTAPGCEAPAQFPAGRENCVTPEHFPLAGAAIYRQIRPAAAD